MHNCLHIARRLHTLIRSMPGTSDTSAIQLCWFCGSVHTTSQFPDVLVLCWFTHSSSLRLAAYCTCVNALCVQFMLSTSPMHQDDTEKKALLCAIAPCQQTLTPSRSELKQVACSVCVEKGSFFSTE